jgi:hypothetical protein
MLCNVQTKCILYFLTHTRKHIETDTIVKLEVTGSVVMMIQQISAVSIKLTYTAGQCHILTDLPTRQELYSQTGRGSTKIYQVNEEG